MIGELKKHHIRLALEIAKTKHKDQVDKGGNPYVGHPLRVYKNLKDDGYSVVFQVVGLLHDILEDTDYPERNIRLIFGSDIYEAVKAITKKKNENRMDYLRKVKNNPIARVVKKYDIKDNMDLKRLKKVTDKDIERTKLYQDALTFLED